MEISKLPPTVVNYRWLIRQQLTTVEATKTSFSVYRNMNQTLSNLVCRLGIKIVNYDRI